ncbi:MAG: hypothetical protein ACQKBT_08005 [Puniceicoccales bacterium]
MSLRQIFQFSLAGSLLLLGGYLRANEPFVIATEGWNYNNSYLSWPHWGDPEKMEAEGKLNQASGWVEYEIEIPEDGWYELWLEGMPSEWTRNVIIDGETLLWHSTSTKADFIDKANGFKEANFWLSQGAHTIRFLRVTWPGDLPDSWQIRSAEDAADCIRYIEGERISQAGTRVPFTFLGGAHFETSYDLVFRNRETGDEFEAGRLEFPVLSGPIEKRIALTMPPEGVYDLVGTANGASLKPADLKAGTIVSVDAVDHTPTPPAIQTSPVITIDCTMDFPEGQFWEKDGGTKVVETSFGAYRESSGEGADGDGYWGLDGFSYKFQLPEVGRLYRIRVTYPDDDRRSMGFWINDGSGKGNLSQSVANTGGVETGDQYPLTMSMLTHEAFFYAKAKEEVVVAVLNLVPGMKAAAASIEIDLVESELPAAPLGKTRGRSLGFYFEENGRWLKFFGGMNGNINEDLKAFNNWGRWNRYIGANLMFPTINVYQGNHFPSKILDGYFSSADNEVRLGALVAEKYDEQFLPEFHLSGQKWFEKEVVGVWVEETEVDGKTVKEVKFRDQAVEDMFLRDRNGKYKHSWEPYVFNALHPRVQQLYIDVLGELADSLGDLDSFAGISSRMMFTWQWQGWNGLPNYNWGYDDWTVDYFEKDTGIQVPGEPGSSDRFSERFTFLMGPARDEWVQWRCDKIFDYHQRILARIQQAKPDAKLYLNWFGLDTRHALSDDMIEQMLEVGMDLERYANQSDIVIIPPSQVYGRRFSIPISDASTTDSLHDDSIKEVGRMDARAYALYSSYYEVNRNLDWSELGGKPYSAFDSCVPSGLNERGMYAQALANSDTRFFVNGGSGWIFGTPSLLQPFLREYRSLPDAPFEPWEEARDPVAVWTYRDEEGTLWFYLVNRLPVEVQVSLGVGDASIWTAPDDERMEVSKGGFALSLEPYMMNAFRAQGCSGLSSIEIEVPEGYAEGLLPLIEFASVLREDLIARRIVPELSHEDYLAALACMDGSIAAYENGEYWKARELLGREIAVQVYYLSGRYPPQLFERSINHGVPELGSNRPEPIEVIAPESWRASSINDLTYDEQGNLWVSADERVGELLESGHARMLSLYRPYSMYVGDNRKSTLQPAQTIGDVWRLIPAGPEEILLEIGSLRPILIESQQGRILPLANKNFNVPGYAQLFCPYGEGQVLLEYRHGNETAVYVYTTDGLLVRKLVEGNASAACANEEGVIFLAMSKTLLVLSPEGEEMQRIELERPLSRIELNGDGDLLVGAYDRSGQLQAFVRNEQGTWEKDWKQSLEAEITALAFSPEGALTVGFKRGTEGAIARNYEVGEDGLGEFSDLMGSLEKGDPWVVTNDSHLKEYEGALYFLANGQLMKIVPGDPDIVEVAFDPGFRDDRPTFESFDFAPNGDLYFSSNYNAKVRGINLFVCRKSDEGWDAPVQLNDGKPLWEGGRNYAADLAALDNGEVLIRDENPGKRGWDLSLYRWSPDAERKLLLSLDNAVEAQYGLAKLEDGGFLVAGGASRVVARLSGDGSIVWKTERAKSSPPGYTDLRNPFGITVDGTGAVWSTDPMRNQVLKFDAEGELIGAFELDGDSSDPVDPLLFSRPTGIAAIEDSSGREWVYVLDSANQRLLKWPVSP